MKLTIERAALLKALAHVQSVVERRNTIPILSNVLITAQKGRLSLAATDMDLAITETVDASAAKTGSTTAPAHTLYEIVRKLPDGAQVELETAADGNSLVIRAGRSRFTLQCLPPADFPAMNEGDLPHRFQLPATDLKGIIDRTRFAISNEETRYYLNGIYFHAAKAAGTDVLRGVATDGHRLARVEVPLPKGAGDIPGVIVPRKTVGEVRKLLDESDGSVDVELSDTRIRFATGNVTLVSKLIDGTFPDYERVIPTGNDKVLNVPCKEFANAVDRVSTISTEKSRAIKLAVGKGVVTLSATSPDAGSATEEIEVDYKEAGLEIGFNSRYLLDITEQIAGAEARFLMADAGSPTLVRDGADESALYVLMPMRV
ncbi:DNA polymerase III subunit beta [Enhydrobacter sp.]|jgi:DNA polymerase-3 subunit beta|uniref:DNA polymerase III subunit beta n=1 Tax=Enhydrobacter sp. TaxID=1894999 RepID=UPI002620BF99|nr:DNA polymerase III subunit beta [Enhydrobacter sp.]WIM11238.1 MAG: DNA polymerase III beta subunit [Enhydrobacter sp.]